MNGLFWGLSLSRVKLSTDAKLFCIVHGLNSLSLSQMGESTDTKNAFAVIISSGPLTILSLFC